MGRTVDEFVEQIANIVEGRVPDLSAAGYQAAAERSIEEIGKELKRVYQSVLEENPLIDGKFGGTVVKIGFLQTHIFRK